MEPNVNIEIIKLVDSLFLGGAAGSKLTKNNEKKRINITTSFDTPEEKRKSEFVILLTPKLKQ